MSKSLARKLAHKYVNIAGLVAASNLPPKLRGEKPRPYREQFIEHSKREADVSKDFGLKPHSKFENYDSGTMQYFAIVNHFAIAMLHDKGKLSVCIFEAEMFEVSTNAALKFVECETFTQVVQQFIDWTQVDQSVPDYNTARAALGVSI